MRRPRSRAALSDPRIFTFDLVVETHPLLACRSGELAELIADGLFALDREGRLFPEALPHLKEGGRLVHVRAEGVGFGRGRAGLTVAQAYAVLMGSKARAEERPDRPTHTTEISASLARLSRAVLRLRALEARGRAASDEFTDVSSPRRGAFVELQELAAYIDHVAATIESVLKRDDRSTEGRE